MLGQSQFRLLPLRRCRALRLRDAHQLPPALVKMSAALAAIPPMEAFVREVTSLVAHHSPLAASAGGELLGAPDHLTRETVVTSFHLWEPLL